MIHDDSSKVHDDDDGWYKLTNKRCYNSHSTNKIEYSHVKRRKGKCQYYFDERVRVQNSHTSCTLTETQSENKCKLLRGLSR